MFLSFLNMRLLRKDFPKFKKHLLEHGKIKTQTQRSFPSDFHFRILHHSWRIKFEKVNFLISKVSDLSLTLGFWKSF